MGWHKNNIDAKNAGHSKRQKNIGLRAEYKYSVDFINKYTKKALRQ
jgi:hypothetical protein